MLGVRREQYSNSLGVLGDLLTGRSVVACPANFERSRELAPPSWLDFFQDG